MAETNKLDFAEDRTLHINFSENERKHLLSGLLNKLKYSSLVKQNPVYFLTSELNSLPDETRKKLEQNLPDLQSIDSDNAHSLIYTLTKLLQKELTSANLSNQLFASEFFEKKAPIVANRLVFKFFKDNINVAFSRQEIINRVLPNLTIKSIDSLISNAINGFTKKLTENQEFRKYTRTSDKLTVYGLFEKNAGMPEGCQQLIDYKTMHKNLQAELLNFFSNNQQNMYSADELTSHFPQIKAKYLLLRHLRNLMGQGSIYQIKEKGQPMKYKKKVQAN